MASRKEWSEWAEREANRINAEAESPHVTVAAAEKPQTWDEVCERMAGELEGGD